MNKTEFLSKARNLISDSPYDRLSTITKEIIDNDNWISDVHCHFFDAKTINIRYFLKRTIKDLLGLRDDQPIYRGDDPNIKFLNTTYDQLHEEESLKSDFDSQEDWDQFNKELDYIEEKGILLENETLEVERGIIDVLKNRQLLTFANTVEVYDFYVSKYGLMQYDELGFHGKDLIVTLLMMDLETGWGVKIRKPFLEQINEIKGVAAKKPILPYLKVDPRREDLYEMFLHAFNPADQSFFGVKLYPGIGYLPSDERLMPIFEICAEKNIPILTHCGGESVTTDDLSLKVNRIGEEDTISGNKREDVARKLNHPREWLPVLKRYPNLKLNLGHFGGTGAWTDHAKVGDNALVKQIFDMMHEYPNVYADFSFNLIKPGLYNSLRSELDADSRVSSRTLYGTDFWVVVPNGNLKRRQLEFLESMGPHLDGMVKDNVKRYLFMN